MWGFDCSMYDVLASDWFNCQARGGLSKVGTSIRTCAVLRICTYLHIMEIQGMYTKNHNTAGGIYIHRYKPRDARFHPSIWCTQSSELTASRDNENIPCELHRAVKVWHEHRGIGGVSGRL